MSNNIVKIGIPSKGRLRSGVLNIFKKNKLKILSERGERDLFGFIKGKKNIIINYLHAREIIERLADGSLDICLLYTSPSPRDKRLSRMPSSA